MLKVSFHYADRHLSLNGKKKIKSFIEHEIFKQEKKPLMHLTYVFCSDDYLLNINRDFLKHDDYTDVITFDLSEADDITGEIYISIDRVKENAATLSIPFSAEIIRVVFHGALHLCGYKDKTRHDILLMRKKEDIYIELFKKGST